MAEDIFLPGKFTDLKDPQQLAQLNELLHDMLARLNQIDPGSVALSWIAGDTAGQVIASKGVGNSPEWDGTPDLTGVKLTGLDASQLVVTDPSKNLASYTPNSGWTVTAGYTSDKAFNPEATTDTEVARVLGTLIDVLKMKGILS